MLAFATALLVTIFVGVFSINRLSVVNDGAVTVSTNYLVASDGLGDVAYNAMRYRQLEAAHILAPTPEAKTKEAASMHVAVEGVTKGWSIYSPTVDAGRERQVADGIQAGWSEYLSLEDKLLALSNAHQNDAATALYTGDMRTVFNKFLDALNQDRAYQVEQGNKITKQIGETYSNSRWLVIVALIVAAAFCVIAGWLIVSGVSTPIRSMTQAMSILAKHDLTVEIIGIGRKDEVGQMASAVQVFKTSMIEGDRLKADQEKAQEAAKARSALVDRLTSDFDTKVQGVVQSVASQAGQMQASAQSMSGTAEEFDQAGRRGCSRLRAERRQCADGCVSCRGIVFLHR